VETATPAPTSEPSPPPAAAPVLAKPAPTSLTDEVAALDGAREALGGGDPGRALRALDDHDRRFPRGALGPEATVLRVEALAQRGDRAAATRLGAAFLAAHPRSPHAARLRTLLGIPAPSSTAAP
jgi:TolA-binding protein